MKKRMLAMGAVCMILIGLLCGCSKKSMVEKRIVGEWFAQSVEDIPDSNEIYFDESEWGMKLEFYEDGSCCIAMICATDGSYEEYDVEYGTYCMEDEDTIQFEWDSDDEVELINITYNKGLSRSKDTFVLSTSNWDSVFFCVRDFMMKS